MNIQNIVQIEYCQLSRLKGMQVMGGSVAVAMPVEADFSQVKLRAVGGCESVASPDGSGISVETVLRFSSLHELPVGLRHVAFRLTESSGRRWLIGSTERPLPVVRLTQRMQPTGSNASCADYEVSWAHRPLLIP
ncbi:MAG: hypothetical protein IJ243_09045 [Prevotella sp.]|nr:hypothetical protein [Prevotella sp.]